jgi:hypothetical protein
MATAAYLANRSPSSTRNFKTPYEIRYGKVPCLSHLRVFGCQAWSHAPKPQRSKLQTRARPAVFVGYEQHRKGYRLFDLRTKEFFSSRDVIFNESSFPGQNWSNEQQTPVVCKFNFDMYYVPEQPPDPTNDQAEYPSITTDYESEGASAPESGASAPEPDDDPESVELSGTQSEEQEVVHDVVAQQRILPKRTRKPPGEWWKANFSHALYEEELTISSRPNIISTNDIINDRTTWSAMLA